ncbi:MAG TPA: RNA methyltransferase [Bacteroidia bacterium]|nr:RNA methyltransferase [Bacteroidia bacterium]
MKSFPISFVNRLVVQFGNERSEQILEALDKPPITSIRYNPFKVKANIAEPKIKWCNEGQLLQERPSFTLDPLFHAGVYYVQEAGSMILMESLKPHVDFNRRLIALDLCAAPGGKATHLLSHLSAESVLIANEVIKSRIAPLVHNLARWGRSNYIITNTDPEKLEQSSLKFDLIIVDAPCSGEGLFRKTNHAIEEWSEENCKLCSSRQKKILSAAYNMLSEGGILYYSTCTLNAEENELNLVWLKNQFGLEFPNMSHLDKFGFHSLSTQGIKAFYILPDKHTSEPYFFSVMKKKGSLTEQAFKDKRENNLSTSVNKLIKTDYSNHVCAFDNHYFLRNKITQTILKDRLLNAKIVKAGSNIGEQKGNDFIPDPSFALSNAIQNEAFPKCSLNLEYSLQFLRKQPVPIDLFEPGWNLVQFQNVNLGFVKHVGSRINNYYPVQWRIENL